VILDGPATAEGNALLKKDIEAVILLLYSVFCVNDLFEVKQV
jgi:hypothetical protein